MALRLPKIFLDSGNPDETRRAKAIVGFLDGQTTNPSLIARHPEVEKFKATGKKFTEEDLLRFYKQVVQEVARDVAGPISVEVYADWETPSSQMLKQAQDMSTWSKNIQIKFPTIPEGLKAASIFIKDGGRVNMTLCFSQTQAAAAYSMALSNPKSGPHFISPFMGRWDDRGLNGLDLLKNIMKMYRIFAKQKKTNILVLASSIRNLDHFYGSVYLGAPLLTVPFKVLHEWVLEEKWIPDANYRIRTHGLKPIIFEKLPLQENFEKYSIERTKDGLLDEGLGKFVTDWKKLLL